MREKQVIVPHFKDPGKIWIKAGRPRRDRVCEVRVTVPETCNCVGEEALLRCSLVYSVPMTAELDAITFISRYKISHR